MRLLDITLLTQDEQYNAGGDLSRVEAMISKSPVKQFTKRLLRCPRCCQEAYIEVTYSEADGNEVRRRRKCRSCKYTFTTVERMVEHEPIHTVWGTF